LSASYLAVLQSRAPTPVAAPSGTPQLRPGKETPTQAVPTGRGRLVDITV
jgi:hypothetical protein